MTPEMKADFERRMQYHRKEADTLSALANQHEGAYQVLRDILSGADKTETAKAGEATTSLAGSGSQEPA
jgi:hypothetical protein